MGALLHPIYGFRFFPARSQRSQAQPKLGCIHLCQAGFAHKESLKIRPLMKPSSAFAW